MKSLLFSLVIIASTILMVIPCDAHADVQIILTVPDGADVWFDGQKTNQTGIVRTYRSEVNAGEGYRYTIRVEAHRIDNGGDRPTEERVILLDSPEVRVSFLSYLIGVPILGSREWRLSRQPSYSPWVRDGRQPPLNYDRNSVRTLYGEYRR